jgi:hypothetical protein
MTRPDVSATVVAWGLTLAGIGLSTWGWLNDGIHAMALFLAAVFVVFQIATNKSGEWARKLWRRSPMTALGVIGFMVIFGLFCHESLKMAWADAEARGWVEQSWLTTALLLALPFAEPFVFWVKHLLQETGDVAQAERVVTDARQDNIVALPKRPSTRRAAVTTVATATAVALSPEAAHSDTALSPPAVHPTHTMRPVIVGNVTAGEDVKVAEASRYRGMGMTREEVAERMGVSPRTVSRYWAKAIALANA